MPKPGDILPESLNFTNFVMIFFGFNFLKFLEFDYTSEAEFVQNKGKDGEIISWTVKGYKRELSVTCMIEELKNLIPLAPGGDLLKLPPAPISASTVVPGVGTLSFEIPAAKIISYPMKFKEGDDKVEVPIKLGLTSYPIITFV